MDHGGFKDLLKNGGFHAFLWTQFLGAFNDNVYKIIVSMRAVHVAANSPNRAASTCRWRERVFVIPVFAILRLLRTSGRRRQQAQRSRRRQSLRSVRDGAGTRGLLLDAHRAGFLLLVLFLMALHSTIFSPAKYGILPEMLPDADLSALPNALPR